MDQQREEVAKLIKKAGVAAAELDLSDRPNPAGAPELAKITGARKPSGTPLPPPNQNVSSQQGGKKKPAGSRNGSQGTPNQPKKGSGRNSTNRRASGNGKGYRSRNGKPGDSRRRGGGQR